MGKAKEITPKRGKKQTLTKESIADEQDTSSSPSSPPAEHFSSQRSFESVYLQQISKEFADDLEKLRTANDFRGERSVQLLVEALKHGTLCYSEDEKQRILKGS